ncbi:hypothetical protein MBLNU457_7144t1 [Dothideomycetes sp. NU457]
MVKQGVCTPSIDAIGVQLGRDRYPQRGEAPSLRGWRINLTGLSRNHNLYFVAYTQRIFVFEPLFPTQSLPPDPALVIHTAPSAPNLRGYLDPHQPHAINNLVVQKLGNEEIIAVVRDDGDVDAYLIRHLAEAIARRRSPGVTLTPLASEVRPFFHQNVGNSAWGLAIHTDARIIAVSSNNHEFNIFAFALLDKAELPSEVLPDDSQGTSSGRDSTHVAWKRTVDEHYVIPNGDENIPCIAFCNTGHDPDGKWLLTTDISGLVQAWDIHNRDSGQALRMGQDTEVVFGFDHENAGWGLAFLDPRSFFEMVDDDAEEALFGMSDLPGLDLSRAMWDLSATRFSVTGAQKDLDVPRETETPSDGNFAPDRHVTQSTQGFALRSTNIPADDNSPVDIESDEEEDVRTEIDYASIFQPIGQLSVHMGATHRPSTSNSEPNSPEPLRADATLQEILDYGPPSIPQPSAAQALQTLLSEIGYFRNTSNVDDSVPSRDAHIKFRSPTSLCPLSCPMLHTSVRNIYLLQPSGKSALSTDHLPAMLLADPWQQRIRHQRSYDLDRIERCCMHAHIPSLGLVIVGNQKGRVAVMSLVKSRRSVDITISRRSTKAQKWVYGMKLEALLPFSGQENAGYRPLAALHGVAVGPLQEYEGSGGEEQRWRIMIMYQDHTVLAYEVGRRRGSVDVADVMI